MEILSAAVIWKSMLLLISIIFLYFKTYLFLLHNAFTTKNYRNKQIPQSMGIFLWVMLFLFTLIQSPGSPSNIVIYVCMSIVFASGWLDDIVGNTLVKGLKGHFYYWLHHKKMTTGLIKIGATTVASIVVALYIVGWSGAAFYIAVSTLLLNTNTYNLLDVRPGRTIKYFHLLFFVFILLEPVLWFEPWVIAMLVGTMVLFPKDIGEKMMIGDSGANLLGFTIGIMSLHTSLWIQCSWLICLIGIHLIAERSAISYWIEKVAILRWFDQLGRVRTSNK
ncbi:hypothetical protein [Longirhabdus pacifica]|uniref:hypothetical protein n=1 Tax=Longirhabdus pacifica TaxID=2305227 RepID=UPI001008A7F9|nr:hypothetical protein [Longirhabdus pacifica]